MLTRKHKLFIGIAALAVVFAMPAATFGYVSIESFAVRAITNNNPTNVATGENQITVDMLDNGSLILGTNITNTGPLAASIVGVYYQDDNGYYNGWGGDSDGLLFLPSTPSIEFSKNASPANLPGGQYTCPKFYTDFSAGADCHASGINPGQSLEIVMDYVTPGFSEGQFPDYLIPAIYNGTFNVGIHVHGFADGGHESFVLDTGASVVPAPSAMLLTIIGVSLVGKLKKRFA